MFNTMTLITFVFGFAFDDDDDEMMIDLPSRIF